MALKKGEGYTKIQQKGNAYNKTLKKGEAPFLPSPDRMARL